MAWDTPLSGAQTCSQGRPAALTWSLRRCVEGPRATGGASLGMRAAASRDRLGRGDRVRLDGAMAQILRVQLRTVPMVTGMTSLTSTVKR